VEIEIGDLAHTPLICSRDYLGTAAFPTDECYSPVANKGSRRRPEKRGRKMFFLFGFRRKAKAVGQMDRQCAKCSRSTIHTAIESKRWFTLFFIPVIPLASDLTVRCNLCGLTLKGWPELKEQLSSKAMAAGA
jgi:zinc-ribbon family